MSPRTRAASTALLVLALAGCAAQTPGSSPDATPSSNAGSGDTGSGDAAASATPSPTPVDPLTTVTQIVIRPQQLDLRDAAGTTIKELSFDLPADQFVAQLTTAIGLDPTTEESDGECCDEWLTYPPTTLYNWGSTQEGVQVSDDHTGRWDAGQWVPEDRPDDDEMNLNIFVTTRTVGEVSFSTVQGYHIGDDLAGYRGSWTDIGSPNLPELPEWAAEGATDAYVVHVGENDWYSAPSMTAPYTVE